MRSMPRYMMFWVMMMVKLRLIIMMPEYMILIDLSLSLIFSSDKILNSVSPRLDQYLQ